jgi:hypothetical protein
MQLTDEEEYELLREELIGYYRRELAYIYTYHDTPPIEFYEPIKNVVTRLILFLNGRKLHDVLAACWKEAWYKEPLCHPGIRYAERERS